MPAVPQSCGSNQNAERLKSEGNAFHVKGQYRAAYKKYTEAIKEDPKNAVYYANRAASSLAVKEYMDAASDAEKATKLDPTYAKAWGRLGAARFAMSSWTLSAEAYRTALNCLPNDDGNATIADKALKNQFLDGLQKAENEKDNVNFKGKAVTPGELPWERAAGLKEEFARAQRFSSAFVVLFAYNEFKEGVTIMKGLEKKHTNGQMMWIGRADALVCMSNGILRDTRVFHFDSTDWVEKYNQQVIFECNKTKAWNMGGAKVIMEEAPQRLRRQGWDALRPALSVTVRAWIMCGFMAKTNERQLVALEYYSRALEVLEWGLRKWENVPTTDRGAIFEMTFIRGVKRLRLIALQECLAEKTMDCQYTREDAAEWSRDIIAEVEANPPGNVELDPGFLASFWMYPKADALTILGWYYMQLGLQANNREDACADFAQSAKYYLEAVDNFLDDDEYVLIYLAVVFEAYMFQGKTVKEVLIITTKMDEALPRMLKVWENSSLKDARDPQIRAVLNFGNECMARVQAGNLSLDAVVKPRSMKKNDKWKTSYIVYI